ncbi:MAG: hypothetical protein L6R38_009596, partial [Xanthoria sp. 2 TBL-2021]
MTEQNTMDTRTPILNTQELETKMIDWEKEISSANFDCDWASCSSHPCHDECSQSNHTYGCGSSSFCDDPSVCMKEDCIEAPCDSSCHSAFEHCPSICAKDLGPVTSHHMILENDANGRQDSRPCPWLLPDQQCDAMLKHHIFEDHLDFSAFSWPDDAVFDRQYPSKNNDSCLAPSNTMAHAVNYPAYLPNGGPHPTQYYGSNLPYPCAYDIDSTGYNHQTATLPSQPNYYHHRSFADQIQTAWHASQPSYLIGAKPGRDSQAADQTKSADVSPAATTPSSKSELQTNWHVCQWIMDSGNNVLCSQVFETTKALQEHLRRKHCTPCSATRPTQKALAICRWNGCSRNCEPLTDVHKLIRHALTHSNYRDYVCSFCEKACTTKGQLVIHERVHTGEKPIKCEFCPKTTSNESQM